MPSPVARRPQTNAELLRNRNSLKPVTRMSDKDIPVPIQQMVPDEDLLRGARGMKAGGMVPPPRFSSGRMDPGRADVVTRGGRTVAAFEVDPDSSQKAADLASEMQREARGKAAGGMVRRGWGKARGA